MKNNWLNIRVFFLVVGIVFAIGCEEKVEPAPKMTALEVCQYINLTKPNEYFYLSPTLRLETRYTTTYASYCGGLLEKQGSEARVPEGIWLVEIKTVQERQQLEYGNWVGTQIVQTSKESFRFDENTGILRLQEE